MLDSIYLENYRCFDNHKIKFKEIAIIVGKNNAGKSTIIEALRLISIVATRALNFQSVPRWLDLPASYKGVSPSLSGFDFSTKNIFHNYSEGPAKIEATFNSKARIEIYLGMDDEKFEVFALIYDSNGKIRKTRQNFGDSGISEINILPQISALAKEEIVLNYDYVRSNITTQLSSLHFRNQIKYYSDAFPKFKELAESTWPGLGINELDGRSLFKGGRLTLIVRDNDFAAEIGWMGHGLQMWLQTMWFLSKSHGESTVILDEPDVYMHADLQRKLIRFLKNRYKQVFLATHSIEIISEVEPENILIIDKTQDKSEYASSLPVVQGLVNTIGSIQNIGLARLWSSRKLLLVEGKDIDILKRIQENIIPGYNDPFDIIPRSSIGGWNGWSFVKGADFVLKNGLKQQINVFCLLDSDYHSQEEISDRICEAEAVGIYLHIWKKKEIENYLIVSSAIFRLVKKSNRTKKPITLELIETTLDDIAEEMKISFTDKIADELQSKNRKWTPSKANKEAREFVDSNWVNKFDLLSGKELISRINKWLEVEFKTSVTANALARSLLPEEVASEMHAVIIAIENNRKF